MWTPSHPVLGGKVGAIVHQNRNTRGLGDRDQPRRPGEPRRHPTSLRRICRHGHVVGIDVRLQGLGKLGGRSNARRRHKVNTQAEEDMTASLIQGNGHS